MSATPPFFKSEELGDSWIELSTNLSQLQDRVTPLPFSSGEEYLRLLKEAQKESNQSSRISSRRDSPKGSPKSPPNSPNPELTNEEELKGIYINYWTAKDDLSHQVKTVTAIHADPNDKDKDWVWEFSSRPDNQPPKDWKFEHPKTKVLPKFSIRYARFGNNSLFSREMAYSILLTNVLTFIFGVGIGAWLTKRGFIFTRLAVE